MKTILTSFFALSLLFILGGCEPTDPAIIKVFVRSSSNQLIDGAKVIIIGDQQSTPATLAYVDTTYTNSSGFTSFDMKATKRVILISLSNTTTKLPMAIPVPKCTPLQLRPSTYPINHHEKDSFICCCSYDTCIFKCMS
jgi:hypothetical protein